MRLELGRRADYAIRATVDLARRHGTPGRRKAREIADDMGIPPSYVPQILADLVRAGLVTSVAGPDGGYTLAADPAAISLADVLHAVDGAVISTSCVLRGGPCHWEDMCAVHVPWARAQQGLLGELASTSMADVVRIDQELDEGSFVLPGDVARPETPPRTVAVSGPGS